MNEDATEMGHSLNNIPFSNMSMNYLSNKPFHGTCVSWTILTNNNKMFSEAERHRLKTLLSPLSAQCSGKDISTFFFYPVVCRHC